MKKTIQVLLFFLIMLVVVGIIGTSQAFATDEYSLSIKTISYTPQSNLMQRSVSVPSAVSDFENVQVDKYIYAGETFSLTAIIVPSNAYVGKVNWTIEQPEPIAKIVSQSGLTVSIQGLKAGTCKIVCTAADGQGAYTTCNLTVLQHATEIRLAPKDLLLKPGDREQIMAVVIPSDTTDQTFSWSSSDPSIAKVDKDGVVTGVSASTTPVTITCKMLDGSGVEATATVNVRVLVEVIEWQEFSNVIYKKGNNVEKFYTSILPNQATIPTLKYTSSNPDVATVIADNYDNNCVIIMPKTPGKFNLICEATDGSNVKLVTEVEVIQLVEYVTLNETSKILFLEDGQTVTYQLQVKTAVPSSANILANGLNNAFIWSSSEDSVATVDQTGLVTAIGPGKTTITATANDIGAASASCTIYVRKPVTSMDIDFYSFQYIQNSANLGINLLEKLKYVDGVAYVYSGDEVALNATLNADATMQNVIWQVDGKGVDSDNRPILGIFASIADPYVNPAIMTAMPVNINNPSGYLNVIITVKATDGSNVDAKRIIQIRQPATSININKTTMTLYTPDSGESFAKQGKLNATILPEYAYINKNPDKFPNGTIIWTSSNEDVATVSSDGHVTAVGVGEAFIYGKSGDGYGQSVSCKVTVLQAIEDIQVSAYQDEDKVEIKNLDYVWAYTNQEIRLFTTITPETATNQKLTWNSGNPAIATVEDGFLKIGNTPTVTNGSKSYITISCSATDGSGKSHTFYLYVLDSKYNIEVNEFLSVQSGDTEKLLLSITKTDVNAEGKPILSPVNANINVSLAGNKVSVGENDHDVFVLKSASGDYVLDGTTLTNVSNPSFDVLGGYNGVGSIVFDITINEAVGILENFPLIGKQISFTKTCTVNVTGNDNRTISAINPTMNLLVDGLSQVNVLVSPATATNYYIKYGVKPYNDDYINPYKHIRVNEDSGVIRGVDTGIAIVTATLYDSTTNEVITNAGVKQEVEIVVYVTESLTGVSMENSLVYVGETLNLLNLVRLAPASLNNIDKSSVLRFEIVDGKDYVKFSSDSFGTITGVSNGSTIIKAIATYGDDIYTSNEATIQVKTRLTNIVLDADYTLKLNQVIKITPQKEPLSGDLTNAKVTWSSNNTNYVTASNNPDDGSNGFSGIITARKSTWNESKKAHEPVTVTVTVTVGGRTMTASMFVSVVPLDVDDFSADKTKKLYTLTTDGTSYYRYGAYGLTSNGGREHYAAGCLENGAFALSTPYFVNMGETSYYDGKFYYPNKYPLKTFVALERTKALLQASAEYCGITYEELLPKVNEAIRVAVELLGDKDTDAYLDLPDKSHFLKFDPATNRYSTYDFDHWGHSSDTTINILTGIFNGFKDTTPSGSSVATDLYPEYIETQMVNTNGSYPRLQGAYFTSALTSLNVFSGNPEIAQRQTNAMSIIGTYLPVDDLYGQTNYQRVHAARQMLIWAVSGIRVDKSEYLVRKSQFPEYAYETENYSGSPLYYVCYMLQADSDKNLSANYVTYPYGYSTFYNMSANYLAPSRFYNIDDIMVIVEGFVWKNDQVERQTVPSFAYSNVDDAKNNKIMMHLDSDGKYKATVADTNGVLNYFNFKMNNVTFTNNGDGTLSISIPANKVSEVIKAQEAEQFAAADPVFIPEDNNYACAAFTKWEMETEISQIPYTKSDGSLGYAYILGNNAQSQYILVKNSPFHANLGDPYDAYVVFDFDAPDEFDSVVESDVTMYDQSGNIVEHVIPNESYCFKYTFTYVGHSRGLEVVNDNTNGFTGTSYMYGFAADMRARSGENTLLKNIAYNTNSYKDGEEFATRTQSETVNDPVYKVIANLVDVKMQGWVTLYETEAGAKINRWTSEEAWYDSIYIDANRNSKDGAVKEIKSEQQMVDSSKFPSHVKVKKLTNGKVEITWEFYTGYMVLTTPYVKASANITIDKDDTYTVEKALNGPNKATDKYIYGLVINGNRIVKSEPGTGSKISTYEEYVGKYSFTGMISNATTMANYKELLDVSEIPDYLFDSGNYLIDNKDANSYSLNELSNLGDNASKLGTIDFAMLNGNVVGLIIDVGSAKDPDTQDITSFAVYWISPSVGGSGRFAGGTRTQAENAFNGINVAFKSRNFESCVVEYEQDANGNYVDQDGNIVDGEGLKGVGSTALYNIGDNSISTSFKKNPYDYWKVDASKVSSTNNIFTLTNPLTYGGSGYMNADFTYAYANNATNYTTFQTDKTYTTVFDLSISNLVVNTGAGITSPTSVDTRNLVNLNVYYTINLDNSAYRVITDRYGRIGGVHWHYYKETDEYGNVQSSPQAYVYDKGSFFYFDSNGNDRYLDEEGEANFVPKPGMTLYYDPEKTGDTSYPDSWSPDGDVPDFIPDARENIIAYNNDLTRPAGWAEEKVLSANIHTDVFTNFCIYDNANRPEAEKLDPASFTILSSDKQWEKLKTMTPTTNLVFIDNIQTGENYVQHTVPYILTSIESGVKVYGFSAHVNKMYNDSITTKTTASGDVVHVSRALAEWGEKVGKIVDSEWSNSTAPGVGHYFNDLPLNDVHEMGSSVLGYQMAYLNRHCALTQSLKVGNTYKKYYYAADYAWAYNNNDTATSMLQYPAYNPHTLSTTSTNGSLVYKNKAGITGFDIVLGNNQPTHIPNTDNISYLMYLRSINPELANNAAFINNSYAAMSGFYDLSTSGNARLRLPDNLTILKYGSLNFYKYSDSSIKIYTASGTYSEPTNTQIVQAATAKTELINSTETETMMITRVLFKSTYTVSRKLGDNGWVDVTDGSHPDAIVNAGKGFELKIEVTYTNNNLTDYKARYLKDSAQVLGNIGSNTSGVTSTGCNISALTGEYGAKSLTDQYTAAVLGNDIWNNVFGANLYKDIYVIMNNNNKYVYSYTGVHGSTKVFDLDTKYDYDGSNFGSVVMTYTMKLSPVNGFFGNSSDGSDKTGLATQNMKFYTDSASAGTVGSLTIWTNPIAATPFGYPSNMKDRYLADMLQIQYSIVQPVDNIDNIVQ